MTKYSIKRVAYCGNDSLNTVLTDEAGNSREERWTREDGIWIYQDGWTCSGMHHGLYEVLRENDSRCDEILNEVMDGYDGLVEFEA